jgi:hypothetical protein
MMTTIKEAIGPWLLAAAVRFIPMLVVVAWIKVLVDDAPGRQTGKIDLKKKKEGRE